MAGDVEQVEAAVTKEVVGFVLSDLEGRIKFDLADITAPIKVLDDRGFAVVACHLLEVALQQWRLLVLRVSWHELLLKARTYD